jgi:CheY-like chemotaxis protein
MELRGQVASSVTHDLNNLLTLIAGYAEMLAGEIGELERPTELVRDILATTSRASAVTGQIQTLGRTQAPTKVVVDPVAVLHSNAEVLERVLGVQIALEWDVAADARNVLIDADQFEQMVLNISINARDAMPEGGRLEIALDEVSVDHDGSPSRVEPGDYVRLRFSDTGVGMDEETRQRCFEPMFTTKGTYRGTGMGLASARRLVEESGGSIECRSVLGEGTTFEVLLPAVEDTAAPAPPVETLPAKGSATVLLAEDDAGLRRLMVQVMRRNGHTVIEAESGEEALALAGAFEGRIDALVSDVRMGEMSGTDLALALQGERPKLRVLLTSGTEPSNVLDGLNPAVSRFMAKPFRPSELVDELHLLLSR